MYYLLVDTDGHIHLASSDLAIANLNLAGIPNASVITLAEEVDISGKHYVDGVLEDIPMPTDELAAVAREERDALLSTTDYLFYTDSPYSSDTVALYRTYRQELRDVPQQEGFPQTITWPVRP